MADVDITITTIDQATAELNQINSAAKELTNTQSKSTAQTKMATEANKQSSFSWTELRSAYRTGVEVIQLAGRALDATAGKTQRYASEVKDLKSITNTSAEETSRLIQVADDWQLSTDQLTMAQKKLATEGMSLSVDTMAKLSDEYQKLNTGTERTMFLTQHFGRVGLDFAKVMEQGGDAIRAQGAAVQDGLILSQAQIDAAEEYRLNQDMLSDNWDAFTMQMGNKVIPVMNDAMWAQTHANEIQEEAIRLRDTGEASTAREARDLAERNVRIKEYTKGLDSAGLSYMKMAEAQAKGMLAETGTPIDYAKLTTDALKLTQADKQYADSVQAINKQYDNGAYVQQLYKTDLAELKDQYKDGELTAREYYDATTELTQSYKDGSYAIQQQTQAMDALDASMDMSTLNLALGQLQQMEDLDPSKVYDFAVATGQITKQAADQAKGQDTLRAAYASGQISAEAYAQALEAISGNMESLNGMSVESFVDVYISYHGGSLGDSTADLIHPELDPRARRAVGARGHAAGKIGVEPGLHPVGEKGEEGLRMNPDGTVDVIPADVWAQAKKWGFGGEGFANGVLGLGGVGGGRKAVSLRNIRGGLRGGRPPSLSSDIRGSSIAGSFAALDGGGELGAASSMVADSNNAMQASMQANIAATQETNNTLVEIRNILANQSSRADEAAQGAYQRNVGING